MYTPILTMQALAIAPRLAWDKVTQGACLQLQVGIQRIFMFGIFLLQLPPDHLTAGVDKNR